MEIGKPERERRIDKPNVPASPAELPAEPAPSREPAREPAPAKQPQPA